MLGLSFVLWTQVAVLACFRESCQACVGQCASLVSWCEYGSGLLCTVAEGQRIEITSGSKLLGLAPILSHGEHGRQVSLSSRFVLGLDRCPLGFSGPLREYVFWAPVSRFEAVLGQALQDQFWITST